MTAASIHTPEDTSKDIISVLLASDSFASEIAPTFGKCGIPWCFKKAEPCCGYCSKHCQEMH